MRTPQLSAARRALFLLSETKKSKRDPRRRTWLAPAPRSRAEATRPATSRVLLDA